MKVEIAKIKLVLDILLNKIEEYNGNSLDLNVDFYWDISFNEIYNPYEEPKNISLGQLSDDLDVINKLSDNHDKIVAYDLKRIAEIIKAISLSSNIEGL